MSETLRIDFKRTRNGKLSLATCDPGGGKIVVSGGYSRTIKGKTGVTDGEDGLIYRMIVLLADSGHEGRQWEAHDGEMVCLEGAVDKKNVPVKYGGEKKSDRI